MRKSKLNQLATRVTKLLAEADAQAESNDHDGQHLRAMGRGDAYTVVLDLLAKLDQGQDIV